VESERGRLIVVRHEERVGPGWLAKAAADAGRPLTEIRLDRGERLPDPAGVEAAGVVVLGGFMAAFDVEEHPWLEAEKRWLRGLVAAEVPVLGICLGAQLLADALGGRAFRAPQYECGYPELVRTPMGLADPVVGVLDGPVLSWHEDTFTLPVGAMLLASSELAPQAFRIGSALGLQLHPEADPETVEGWIAHVTEDGLRRRGADPDALRAVALGRADEVEAAGRGLLDAWLATLTEA
jgi:GMP synthase (glutamine-hydrolysing)